MPKLRMISCYMKAWFLIISVLVGLSTTVPVVDALLHVRSPTTSTPTHRSLSTTRSSSPFSHVAAPTARASCAVRRKILPSSSSICAASVDSSSINNDTQYNEVLQQQHQQQGQEQHPTSSQSSSSSSSLDEQQREEEVTSTVVLSSSDSAVDDGSTSASTTSTTTKTYPLAPTFTECLAFALPALGIYVCPPLMSLIDTTFVGRTGNTIELAALGPASSISDCAPLPLLFLSIGATNLIAKSYASKDTEMSSRVSRTAIGMGSICGLLLALVLYKLSYPISLLYCGGKTSALAHTLAPACTNYVAIRALALPFVVITTIAQAICIGIKDTKTPMISVGIAAILNLLGDFILVKYLKMGIVGAAWATSASQIVAAGLLLRVLKKRGLLSLTRKQEQIDEKKEPSASSSTTLPEEMMAALDTDSGVVKSEKTPANRPSSSPNAAMSTTSSTMATVKQLLSFIPFLFIMTVKIGWHNSCTATAATLGGVSAAAHTALVSVAMVCMVLGDVGSSLSQAFLPAFEETSKEGDDDKSTSSSSSNFNMEAAMPTIKQLLKCTITISATVTTFAAIMIGIFGGQITNDVAVLSEMKNVLPWIVTTLCFHGSAVTLEGLLLSRKMFQSLSICYTILAITVAAFQIATRKFNLGLGPGVWGCYVWFCLSRVITFSILGGLLRPKQRITNLIQKINCRIRNDDNKKSLAEQPLL